MDRVSPTRGSKKNTGCLHEATSDTSPIKALRYLPTVSRDDSVAPLIVPLAFPGSSRDRTEIMMACGYFVLGQVNFYMHQDGARVLPRCSHCYSRSTRRGHFLKFPPFTMRQHIAALCGPPLNYGASSGLFSMEWTKHGWTHCHKSRVWRLVAAISLRNFRPRHK
jgi:hypothetical protein